MHFSRDFRQNTSIFFAWGGLNGGGGCAYYFSGNQDFGRGVRLISGAFITYSLVSEKMLIMFTTAGGTVRKVAMVSTFTNMSS